MSFTFQVVQIILQITKMSFYLLKFLKYILLSFLFPPNIFKPIKNFSNISTRFWGLTKPHDKMVMQIWVFRRWTRRYMNEDRTSSSIFVPLEGEWEIVYTVKIVEGEEEKKTQLESPYLELPIKSYALPKFAENQSGIGWCS